MDAILVLSVLFAHWGMTLALAVIGIAVFPRYGEVIAAGILLDLLYGSGGGVPVLPVPVLFTVISIILYSGGTFVKRILRPYDLFS